MAVSRCSDLLADVRSLKRMKSDTSGVFSLNAGTGRNRTATSKEVVAADFQIIAIFYDRGWAIVVKKGVIYLEIIIVRFKFV